VAVGGGAPRAIAPPRSHRRLRRPPWQRTQTHLRKDRKVLYISTHQYPYYPGTGAADEIGREAGRGFTVNLPLEVGAVDEDYQIAFSQVGAAGRSQFGAHLLIISAGFDAHERDPLGGMRLTTPAFAPMTSELRAGADECCRAASSPLLKG